MLWARFNGYATRDVMAEARTSMMFRSVTLHLDAAGTWGGGERVGETLLIKLIVF